MNKEIDEIALRVAKERYVTAHAGTGEGIDFSNYSEFTRALLAELAKVSEPVAYKHSIMGADYYKDHPSPYPITEEIPLYTYPPLPQPDLVAEIERLKVERDNHQLDINAELRQQLSAAQTEIEQLVKALDRCKFDSLNMTFDDLKFIREAIAAHKARQAKCDPTLTLCPRCNNDIFKCDGAYKARQQEKEQQ